MKADWKDETLGGLFEIGSSKRVLQKQWKSKGVPFYRAREIVKLAKEGSAENDLFISEDHFTELKDKHGVPSPGDLMVSAVGTLGACYVVQPGDRFYFKDASVLRLHPKMEVCSRFYQYAFQWNGLLDIVKKSDGATVGTLTISRAKGIPVPLPPLEEQRRIVAVLDEAFEGLSRARTHAEANLRDARGLFASAVARVFEGSTEWPQPQISEIGQVFDGPHATPKTVEAGPLFLGISSLVDGRIELTKTRHVTEDDFAKWTRRVTPQAGDIVFSYETRLGQVGLVPDGMRCCLGRRMGLVRLRPELADPEYFVLAYLSPAFQRFLKGRVVQGATVDRLSIKEFPSFPFPVPTLDRQEEVVRQIHSIRDRADHLIILAEQKLHDLDDLRQSLLQKAFAGELT